ncbi:DUF4912 domain-containing protein [Garciella nitratireducens]|uniref:DUF4912 domain-containing protein n=1 Tax=Garciella nitratireducens DSM 15102 TaxID=1121911 RepID=A0A1T4KRN2_9FIRM|nr:DUF4912 domain-containing protein [Garciella nitratireducens]RBP39541.1 uncharacterized protein DUF4912 [Garciella nitratireducens]SJZ45084.1 protein of unknown function [Garciella nitratireducens DSM 15102]
MKNSKIKINLLLPHILYSQWKLPKESVKKFINDFGYWAWEESKPTLKIYINDITILGEQESFFINLKENDTECAFFVPYDNKKYKIEYGRMLHQNIFLSLISSNFIIHPSDQYYSTFCLPHHIVESMKYLNICENYCV